MDQPVMAKLAPARYGPSAIAAFCAIAFFAGIVIGVFGNKLMLYKYMEKHPELQMEYWKEEWKDL